MPRLISNTSGGHEEGDKVRFQDALAEAFEANLIVDAVIAQSKQQREDLWAIRDDIEYLTQKLYPPILFDVSLGIPEMDAYVEEIRTQLKERWPASQIISFGHLGDGNIHLLITVGSYEADEVHAVENIVYEALGRCQGIVSAEHGIGLDKREHLKHSRSEVEISLMRSLKQALDPKGILNRGKIFE